jgi:hypothetical protein
MANQWTLIYLSKYAKWIGIGLIILAVILIFL